ncbi:MAG: hypothetical protein CME32_32225 [Gimesia sp.]|nr:hypothetical protein [Gimesia sp.]
MEKPTNASGYTTEAVKLARATCLYVATKLGDLRDEFAIVGGLVPSLLIPQEVLDESQPTHVGTMDVDLGLAIAVLTEKRYQEICERLKSAGFRPDENAEGNQTNQRWRIDVESHAVTVDFLIPPTQEKDKGGRLKNLEADFAAIITPGLELAFQDFERVEIDGETIHGEKARREVRVCGPGAFVVLKSLAFDGRGENKDAYDLIYLIQNYGSDETEIANRIDRLRDNEMTSRALEILTRDFDDLDSLGPRRVAEFLGEPDNTNIRADAAGSVRSLMSHLGRP